jgi:hypothetical protein
MANIELDVKVDGKVAKSISVGQRGEDNPFSSGSIGYHTNDTIDLNGNGHTLNVLMVQKGTKGKYSSD